MSSINKIRKTLYKTASILGDINAIKSGDPKKIAKRIIRKQSTKKSSSILNKLFK